MKDDDYDKWNIRGNPTGWKLIVVDFDSWEAIGLDCIKLWALGTPILKQAKLVREGKAKRGWVSLGLARLGKFRLGYVR